MDVTAVTKVVDRHKETRRREGASSTAYYECMTFQ